VHRLWPQPSVLDLDDAALAAHYAWPETRAVPYVRVNFVSSLDGAVTVDGRTAAPVTLGRGSATVAFNGGPDEALLLPRGDYAGKFAPGADNSHLFDGVYD